MHVINTGPTLAEGDVPDWQIQAQVDVLDENLDGPHSRSSSTDFDFRLAGTDRTATPPWFNMSPQASEERAAERALPEGGPGALNFYLRRGRRLPAFGVLPEGRSPAPTAAGTSTAS